MNGKQHRQIGAVVGAGYTVVKYLWEKQDNPDLEFPWGDLVINTGVGFALGSLPDWIEPATSPNHRKFFHSIAAGTGVWYGAFGKHTEEWDEDLKKWLQACAVAYLSHLAADSTTARSIALLHPKII